MDECSEGTPLLVKANQGAWPVEAGEKQLSGQSGSMWDALGPVTSAIVCLPVLLAH